MNNIIRKRGSFCFIVILLLSGCVFSDPKSKDYSEVPSMLNVLTNKAQIAIEEGIYTQGGETAVLAYIRNKNPNILIWFSDQGLELRIGEIANTAIVMVCDHGVPIYEDTYCNPGAPDKDHRASSGAQCEIAMTKVEVFKICD